MPKPTKAALIDACEALAKKDKYLAMAYKKYGAPQWRYRPNNYASIARIIAFQQISTKAATTIWGRVEILLNNDITPENMLRADVDDLKACGLSRPKINHLTSIATAITDGALKLRSLSRLSLEDATAHLVAVKGIGPWTATVHLMALGRLDPFPFADIGLSEAYKMLQNEAHPRKEFERMSVKDFEKLGQKWQPYGAVAAHLLWGYINAVRADKF